MNGPNQSITGITEVALRVHDLDLMRRFCEQGIGLEVLREINDSGGAVIFYSVGAGNDHLALFEEKRIDWFTRDKSPQIDPKPSWKYGPESAAKRSRPNIRSGYTSGRRKPVSTIINPGRAN